MEKIIQIISVYKCSLSLKEVLWLNFVIKLNKYL